MKLLLILMWSLLILSTATSHVGISLNTHGLLQVFVTSPCRKPRVRELSVTVTEAASSQILLEQPLEWKNGEWSMTTFLIPIQSKQQTFIVTLWDGEMILTRRLTTLPQQRKAALVSRVDLVYPCNKSTNSRCIFDWPSWTISILLVAMVGGSALRKTGPGTSEPETNFAVARYYSNSNDSQAENSFESEDGDDMTREVHQDGKSSSEVDHSITNFSSTDVDDEWDRRETVQFESHYSHQLSRDDHTLHSDTVVHGCNVEHFEVEIERETSCHDEIVNAGKQLALTTVQELEQHEESNFHIQESALSRPPALDHMECINTSENVSLFQPSQCENVEMSTVGRDEGKGAGQDKDHGPDDKEDSSKSYVSTLPPDSDLVSEDVDSKRNIGIHARVECTTPPSHSQSPKGPIPSNSSQNVPAHSFSHYHGQGAANHCEVVPQHLTSPFTRSTPGKREREDFPSSILLDHEALRLGDEPDLDVTKNHVQGDDSSVGIIFCTSTQSSSRKRRRRPFFTSQIVPDWVPSKGLQSISNNFIEDSDWNMAIEGTTTSSNLPLASPIPKSIQIRRPSNRKSQDKSSDAM